MCWQSEGMGTSLFLQAVDVAPPKSIERED